MLPAFALRECLNQNLFPELNKLCLTDVPAQFIVSKVKGPLNSLGPMFVVNETPLARIPDGNPDETFIYIPHFITHLFNYGNANLRAKKDPHFW